MKTIYFSSHLLIAVALSSFPAASSYAGSEGVGGGFADRNGRKILQVAISELGSLVTSVNAPTFGQYPERRAITLEALRNIQIRSLDFRVRDGRNLVMDYDDLRKEVTVLRPYFDGFIAAPLDGRSVLATEELLLHEIAHLWGEGEDAADRFASEILSSPVAAFSRNVGGLCSDLDIVKPSSGFDPEKTVTTFGACIDSLKSRWCSSTPSIPALNDTRDTGCRATEGVIDGIYRGFWTCLENIGVDVRDRYLRDGWDRHLTPSNRSAFTEAGWKRVMGFIMNTNRAERAYSHYGIRLKDCVPVGR